MFTANDSLIINSYCRADIRTCDIIRIAWQLIKKLSIFGFYYSAFYDTKKRNGLTPAMDLSINEENLYMTIFAMLLILRMSKCVSAP